MPSKEKRILITGAAGFIGFHLSRYLLMQGEPVTGVDNLNPYYDVDLKQARLNQLKAFAGFEFKKQDICDKNALEDIFQSASFDVVVHLAAQAGVRYSLTHPMAYVDANLIAFVNVLECIRAFPVSHFLFASSSSVYGLNGKIPLSVHDNVDHPVSLYAATKKSNELMAHAYSHLYGIPVTGLRFFTVYGPWGRPDMALFLFTKAILNDEPIHVFNHGDMKRDFTYIDDIVEGIARMIRRPPGPNAAWNPEKPDPGSSPNPYRIYNIGNNQPVALNVFIQQIEKALGKTAVKEYHALQPGDVVSTYADIDDLVNDFDFRPKTSIETGINRFVEWYRAYMVKGET